MKVGVVYTPQEVHPDVLEWVTDRYEGDVNITPFMKHLMALRRASCLDSDVMDIVIVEEGSSLCDGFESRVQEIINLIPPKYNTCLLSHYVVNTWDGISFVPGTNNYLCAPTTNVQGSWGYWIRRTYAEYLLALYDQPLYYISSFQLSPESITRLGNVCMVHKPLVASTDTDAKRNYFKTLGFNI